MAWQAKAFSTFFTCVRAQVSVTPPVLTQITRRGVTAMAVWTFKGLFSRVYPLMLHQITGLSKTLVAFSAFVGSLTSVGALVVSQMWKPNEPFAADCAVVRPFSSVCPQVYFQRPKISDLQPTVPALVNFLIGVDFGVNSQVSLGVKVLPAHIAVEGFLTGMRPQVENQTWLESKLLSTFRARIFLLARVCG